MERRIEVGWGEEGATMVEERVGSGREVVKQKREGRKGGRKGKDT